MKCSFQSAQVVNNISSGFALLPATLGTRVAFPAAVICLGAGWQLWIHSALSLTPSSSQSCQSPQKGHQSHQAGEEMRGFKCRSHLSHAAEPAGKSKRGNQCCLKVTPFGLGLPFLQLWSLLQDVLQQLFLPSLNKCICLTPEFSLKSCSVASERAAPSAAAALSCVL